MNWFESFIAKRIAKRVRKELEMTGWKTKTAAIGAIASGVGLIIAGVAGDQFDFDSIKQGVAAIIAGLGLLGIGHKIEKSGNGK